MSVRKDTVLKPRVYVVKKAVMTTDVGQQLREDGKSVKRKLFTLN